MRRTLDRVCLLFAPSRNDDCSPPGGFISKSKSPRSQRKRRGSGGFSRIPHRRGRQPRLRNCDLQLAKRAIVKSCRGVIDPRATGTPTDERWLTPRCISKIDFSRQDLSRYRYTSLGFYLDSSARTTWRPMRMTPAIVCRVTKHLEREVYAPTVCTRFKYAIRRLLFSVCIAYCKKQIRRNN